MSENNGRGFPDFIMVNASLGLLYQQSEKKGYTLSLEFRIIGHEGKSFAIVSHSMFLQKQDDTLHHIRKVIMEIDMIKDICFVFPDKPPAPDSCIGQEKPMGQVGLAID